MSRRNTKIPICGIWAVLLSLSVGSYAGNDGLVRGKSAIYSCPALFNQLFHEWRGQRSFAYDTPGSQFDSLDPRPYFPAENTEKLKTGLKFARERARFWTVVVPTTDRKVRAGRVVEVSYTNPLFAVLADETTGERYTIYLDDMVPSEVQLVPKMYIPPGDLSTALPSQIAARSGLFFAVHGISTEDTLVTRLSGPRMDPIDPGKEQWRIANYMELIGPQQVRTIRMRNFSLVFRLRVLDRDDYFVTPLQNFGTRIERSVDVADSKALATLFWEIAGNHGTGHNEVVVRGPLFFEDLVEIHVGAERYESVLNRLKQSGLKSPDGRPWEQWIVISTSFEGRQIP